MTDYRPQRPTSTPTEALLEAGHTVGDHLRTLPELLPHAADYTGLRKRWGTELLSGATVGVVALPLALGFGVASGAGATAGIVTAIVAGILAAVFGGSHLQVSGPTGAMTVVLLPVIARYGVDKIPLLAIMAGVLLLVLAVAGLGRAVDLIPWPVVEGFTMGIGVIIFLQQFPLALGTPKGESESTLISAWQTLAATDWTKAWLPLLIVALVLVVHLALSPIKRNVPIALVAVVVGTLVAWAFNLDIERIGALPTGLPMPSIPGFDFRMLTSLAAPALAIAALAALESLLSARVADGMAPDVPRTNADRELFGQGIANIGSGLFGGLPATGAIARTAVNVRSGARTRVSAVFHSIVLAIIVWTLAPLVSQVPLAALAGVLMWTAIRMVNVRLGKRIMFTTRADRTTFLLTLAATIALDLVMAVLLGVAMAAVHSLRHMASYSVVRREELQTSLLPPAIAAELDVSLLRTRSLYGILWHDLGIRIDRATETVRATSLDAESATLLGRTEGEPALLSARLTHSADGRAVVDDRALTAGDSVVVVAERRASEPGLEFKLAAGDADLL